MIFFRDESSVTGRYPVHEIFRHLESGDGKGFVEHVANNVDWTVEGTHPGTHPLAGPYQSQDDFLAHTLERPARVLRRGAQLHVQNVLLSDNQGVLEARSEATAKNGA